MRREKLRGLAPLEGPRPMDDLRVRQLRARDLLRGELDADELEKHVEEALLTTRLDKLQAWGRSNSVFPLTFGLGDATRVSEIRVRWPGGRVETIGGAAADTSVTIQEGKGTVDQQPLRRAGAARLKRP